MKKHISYLLVLFAASFAATSCYKDKGNYDYTELGAFYIDDTGMKTYHAIPIFSVLELNSGLIYDGNREDLEFMWRAYSSWSTVAPTILSDEENLSAPIPMIPGEYTLEFRATEKPTGRIATFSHTVLVESNGSGILVLYKEDGLTDCGLISPKILFGHLDRDAVSLNMYTLANPDYPLTGDPVAIEMYKDSNFQHISIFTEDDGVRISPNDMSITEKFEDFFAFAPRTVKPQWYIAPCGVTSATSDFESSDGMEYFINDGVFYANVILFGFGSKTVFGERTMTGGYYAAPFVLQGQGMSVTYDTGAGRFISAGILATTLSQVGGELGTLGKDLVAMHYGFGAQYAANAILRDREPFTDKYHFYVINMSNNTTMNKWEISNYANIAAATSFAFGRRAQLAFYTDGNAIYQIKYDMTGNTIEDNAVTAWSGLASGETITAMQLCPHPGRNLTYNARERYLFVGTYNESTREGKVYILEVNIETDGSLKAQPVGTYAGFGKIKDFGFKF